MSETYIKWFDLSRFGASLRVMPESPLRGQALSILDVVDTTVFTDQFCEPLGGWQNTTEFRNMVWARFDEQKAALGFGKEAIPVSTMGPDGEAKTLRRHFSLRTEFSLSELRGLFPSLAASDYRELPRDDILVSATADPENVEHWASFAREVLSRELVGVLTPKVSRYPDKYADAVEVKEIQPKERHRAFRSGCVSTHFGVLDGLASGRVRTNALIDVYADEASARADGFGADDLKRIDLPYGLPLFVGDHGRVTALRDVRFAPEIMAFSPVQCFPKHENGLAIPVLRDLQAAQSLVDPRLAELRAWASDPESLSDARALSDSLQSLVDAMADVGKRHPRLMPALRGIGEDGKLSELPEKNEILRLLSEALTYASAGEVERCTNLPDMAERLIVRRDSLAMERLQSVLASAQTVSLAQRSEDAATVKHVDAGEKIGGARKDYHRRSLTIDDLDSMNELERQTFVTKKNVWASLDYRQMREEGVTPEAAMALKMWKDSLNTEPDRRYDDVTDEVYIEAIGLVRDAVSEARTVEDVTKAMVALFVAGTGQSLEEIKAHRSYYTFGKPVQTAWGRDACKLIEEAYLYGALPSKIRKAIRRKVNQYDDNASIDVKWQALIKPSRTKSDEEKELDRERADKDRLWHRPHLDCVERIAGNDWRDGRDVVADDILEHFGFRAIEFGNWLPQDERQQVLNMAFDALNDLAQALELPPQAVSLDGSLAIAFGSRGTGGRHAALAHYEPLRQVINLTRLNGAGTLAHEWFHAFDHALGQYAGYASEDGCAKFPESARLTSVMRERLGDPEQIRDASTGNYRRAASNVMSWLWKYDGEERARITTWLDQRIDQLRHAWTLDIASRLGGYMASPNYKSSGFGCYGLTAAGSKLDAVDAIMEDLGKRLSDKSGFKGKERKSVEGNLSYLAQELAICCTVDAVLGEKADFPDAFLTGKHAQPTGFYASAVKMDQTRSEPYWHTTRELFARAGASYVHDRLASLGIRSDYLVFGAEDGRYSDESGNPNPSGVDREVINRHFDGLMDVYRLDLAKRMLSSSAPSPEV